jgi:predicted DNA-binding transcriptional regulator AlpA
VELVGLTEVGEMLGVSREHADELAQAPDFPPPIGLLRAGPIWERDDVVAWARLTGRAQ